MTVIFQTSYTLGGSDQPLTHARMAHSENWLSGATITATSTATDYDVTALDNSLTYEKWKATSSADQNIDFDFGSTVTPDYCCIAGHDLGTQAADIRLQYDVGGGTWTNIIGLVSITSDSPIYIMFRGLTYQNWRLKVVGPTAAPTISVVKFGTALQFPRPFFSGHSPTDLNRMVSMRSNLSETGEYLGRTRQRIARPAEFSWDNLDYSWVIANWPSVQDAVEAEPFWLAWRPNGTYDGVGYFQAKEVPNPSFNGKRDLMAVSIAAQGLGWS